MGHQTSERSKTNIHRRDYIARNPEFQMVINAKQRAKKHGWDFDLTPSEINVPSHCPVLNIPLVFTNNKQSPDSPSLHRIDPSKGYTKDNVCGVRRRANDLLKDAALAELVAITVWMAAVG